MDRTGTGSRVFSGSEVFAINSIDDLIRAHPEFKWREMPVKEVGGRMVMAVLSHERLTGNLLFMFAMERCTSPEHEHLGNDGTYLEWNSLCGGEMEDLDDEGKLVIMHAGDTLKHYGGAGRTHSPRTKTFCWGFSHQPHGSQLTGN